MLVRELVFTSLTTDAAINNNGITVDNTFLSPAVVHTEATKFMVLRWGAVLPGIGPASRARLDVWVYDKNGADYSVIDDVLKLVRTRMLNLAASGQGDTWFLGVEWSGNSVDTKDDVYEAVAKYASFSVTASGL